MNAYEEKPWLKSYESDVPRDVGAYDFPVTKLLETTTGKYPDAPAIIFKGATLSYRELDDLTDAIAASLTAQGFQKGDRAVIYMPNIPQFVITYYGILKAGGIVIATNPLYTERELEHQLADCGAEIVFVMSLFYEQLKAVQSGGHTNVKQIVVTNIKEYLPFHLKLLFTLLKEGPEGHRVRLQPGDSHYQEFLAAGKRYPKPDVELDGSDVALLQYTGGTTGLSKGAVGLHRNLVANTLAMKAWLPKVKEPGEVFLTAIPLFHSYGMIAAMNFGILLGGTLVMIVNPRDQDDLLGSINKYRATIFPGVPALYVAINNNPDVAAGKYDIKSVRICLSGSAPLLQETKQRFETLTGGKLVEAFGLTEAHVATHANPIYGENRPGSIGLPLPGVDCKIVNTSDGQTVLPVGDVGELVIKSPSVMQGYWNMPTETANTLRDGWLYTGDIARMDEDGYFYIEDRKKDMIICGGYNVYPREVEEVLAGHPAIMEVAVAGVQDPKRGETVKAWVVKIPGEELSEGELIEWSKGQLARYKYPRMVEFLDELPKSGVGKVLKRELVKEHEHA